MLSPDRIAVVIGVGEAIDRNRDPILVPEPTQLIANALRAAAEDAGSGWLNRIDSIDLVAISSWRYLDPVTDVCAHLGISPARMVNSRRGGETPIRLLHEAAIKVTSGQSTVCAIVGGEATNARGRARRGNATLPWPPLPSTEKSFDFPGLSTVRSVLAQRYNMLEPARIYPLYETAIQAAWSQSPGEAHEDSAKLWAQYAKVAKNNPQSWIKEAPDVASIRTIDSDNRMVNWPYPKLMVANPSVNQAAAFIVTTLANARSAGIPDKQLIYVLGGAAAKEPDDFLLRGRYDRCPAQEAVLDKAADLAGGRDQIGLIELYSCFPVVPKMAIRHMGLPADMSPSVTGGLTFFGGPLHNYMSHAVCAMVRALRTRGENVGMLYGQGGYLTKHHAVLLGINAPDQALPLDYSVQAVADAAQFPVPVVCNDYTGPAVVEAYTVGYARDGRAHQGIVVVRTPEGDRTMACIPPEDEATLGLLQSWEQTAIGLHGSILPGVDGVNYWAPDAQTASEVPTT